VDKDGKDVAVADQTCKVDDKEYRVSGIIPSRKDLVDTYPTGNWRPWHFRYQRQRGCYLVHR
jgi:hypothetical protein